MSFHTVAVSARPVSNKSALADRKICGEGGLVERPGSRGCPSRANYGRQKRAWDAMI
jgi:hypothetical protein